MERFEARGARWRLLALGTLAVLVAACGGGTSNSSSSSSNSAPYIVGGIGPLSGAAASTRALSDGAVSYFNQMNRDGTKINGRKVEFISMDDKGVPDTAVADVRDLQSRGASAIVGPQTSTDLVAAVPVAKQVQIPLIAAGPTTSMLVPAQPYVYLGDISAISDMYFEIDFTKNYLKLPTTAKIAFIGASTTSGSEQLGVMQKQLPSAGYQLTYTEQVPSNATDLSSTAAKVKASGAGAVMMGLPDATATLLVNALGSLAVNVPLIDYHAVAPGTVLKMNNPNFYFVRQFELTTANNPAMKKVTAAAATDNLTDEFNGSYGFLTSWVSAAIIAAALKNCQGQCTGADMEKALEKVKVDIPGILFSTIQYSKTRHQAIGSGKFYHVDKPDGSLVQAGTRTYTKFLDTGV